MNWDVIEGNWRQLKGKALETWSRLTQEDLDRLDGRRERIVGRLQQVYGISKDEAERQVDDWSKRSAPDRSTA